MKETNGENTTKKKKLIYSLILAASVLLIAAATTLTVYFVTRGNNDILESPIEEPGDGDANGNDTPDGGDADGETPDGSEEPDAPSGGDGAVKFVAPIENAVCTVDYDSIYVNASLGGQIRIHKGVDYSADEGTAVYAISAGTVLTISYSAELGNLITIDHGDGLLSLYRFVEPAEGLQEGDTVAAGQQIATVAAAYGTEYKDGAHLHFELTLNDDWVDPADYFDVTYDEK